MQFLRLSNASIGSALCMAAAISLSCKNGATDVGAEGATNPTTSGENNQAPDSGAVAKPDPSKGTPPGTGGTSGSAGGMGGGFGLPVVIDGSGGSPAKKDASFTPDPTPTFKPDAAPAGNPRDSAPLPPAPNLSSVECKDAKLCDDFEAYPAAAAPGGGWKVSTSKGGTLVVDDKKAYSGTKSILITTPGMTASAWMTRDRSVFPLVNNAIYGRMMTFLSAAPKGAVHWNNIQATGIRPDTKANSAYQWGAMFEKVMANYWPPDCSKSSKTSWPVGKWSCVQWQFDGSPNAAGDGRKNEMRLWVDGTLLNDTTIVRFGTGCVNAVPKDNEWVAPTFTSLRLGWENYQTSPIPIEMWIDDVAVDPSHPISCPAPK